MDGTRVTRTLSRSAVFLAAWACAGSAAAAAPATQTEEEAVASHDPLWNEIRLSVTDESFWGEWRNPYSRGHGYWSVELFANDDDDVALSVGVLRTSPPKGDGVRLGVGLEAYAFSLDGPDDEVYGIALSGMASYMLPTYYPVTVSAEVAYAPDVTTFDGADGIFDFSLQAELEISESAHAFVGYRKLELDLPGGVDYEPQDSFYVGVGLRL